MNASMQQLPAKSKSLTRQVLVRLFAIATLVFLLIELSIVVSVHRTLILSLDKALLTRAESLALVAEVGLNGKIEFDFADEVMPDFSGARPQAYFIIIHLKDYSEVERSISLHNKDLELPPRLDTLESGESYFWNTHVARHRIRCIALRESVRLEEDVSGEIHPTSEQLGDCISPGNNECLFVVGLDLNDVDDRFWNIVGLTSTALGLGLGGLVLLGWIAIRKSLNPLFHLEKEVQSLSASNLTPVSVPAVREIAVVAETINHAIDNLKEAFERERRFTADVAHELRTPVSEIRTMAEVAMRWKDRLDDENFKNYSDILSSACQMQATINSLLTLARCDAGVMQCQESSVQLGPVVQSIVERFRNKAGEKHISIHEIAPCDLSVITDKEILDTILSNLFSNAVEYTPEGGSIEWETMVHDRYCVFAISNHTTGLTEEDVPHLFERFWRKDEARVSKDAHSGLGLTLAQSLASILGLSLKAQFLPNHVLKLTLGQLKCQ